MGPRNDEEDQKFWPFLELKRRSRRCWDRLHFTVCQAQIEVSSHFNVAVGGKPSYLHFTSEETEA